jgi:hypothetical protein
LSALFSLRSLLLDDTVVCSVLPQWGRWPWAIEGQNQSRWHRVYYEDPQSLGLKYRLATAAGPGGLGQFGGFGMWTASAAIAAMGPAVQRGMWAAVPALGRG